MYGFHTRNQLENQNLQVSLHSSDQLERNHLIPWGKPSSDGYLPGEILPFLTVYQSIRKDILNQVNLHFNFLPLAHAQVDI